MLSRTRSSLASISAKVARSSDLSSDREVVPGGQFADRHPHAGDLPGKEVHVGAALCGLLTVLSRATRSRASCRFWASRISGAAYEACNDKIRVRKMNGYASNAGRGGPNGTFQITQMHDDHGHASQESGGSHEAGEALGELAERVPVDLERGQGRPLPPPGRVQPLDLRVRP